PHFRASLNHFAHEFMAENVAAFHPGDVAVVDVQIGAADGGERDAHDGIVRIQNARVGNRLHAHIIRAVPADRFHAVTSSGFDQAGSRLSAFMELWRTAPLGWPSAVGISPASRYALSRPRSASISVEGSRPNSFATIAPATPAGGLY